MARLCGLCSSKGDKSDDVHDTPTRPAQKSPTKGTQSLPAGVNRGPLSREISTDKPTRRDLWKEAFDGLDPSRKQYLPENGPATENSIQKVIDDTTAKYEEWKKGGLKIHRRDGNDINLRDSTERIISGAMKFQHIVSTAVSFDSTGYVSSAWTVISFGMSIVQNRLDRRDAIFAASDYLAETLAYYALVDENYRNQGVQSDKNIDEVLLRVYSAILNFTAQVKKDQEENEACRIWNSLLALTDQPLGELKASIDAQGENFQKWSFLASNLGDRKLAEAHLAEIDRAIEIARNIESRIINMEEERQIEWISVAPYWRRQQALQDKRTDDTGHWFLNSKEYNHWKVTPGDILWLSGISGCGKSVLCSTVIRDLEEICRLDPSKFVAYWYFEFGVEATKSVDGLIRSLIRQLSWSPLVSSITDVWKENHRRGSQPDSSTILAVLDDVLSRISGQVYLVFDALDECPQNANFKERESLLAFLLRLLGRYQDKVHILATGRPEQDITQALKKFSVIDLEVPLVEDVKKFVTASIAQHLNRWDEEVKKLIFAALLGSRERRFRWAELQIIELQKCHNEAAIKQTLHEVPRSLEETYRRVLDSIEPKFVPLARNILTLICLSPITLHVKTVADMVDMRFPEDLVKICTTSLVSVFDDKIQLAHFSVQEFLVVSEKQSDHHEFQFLATSGHQYLAKMAVDCLLAQTKLLYKSDAKKLPWFLYATKHWNTHLAAGGGVDQTQLKRLFTQPIYHNWVCGASMSAEFDTEEFDKESWDSFNMKFGPPIHGASVLGFVDVVDSLFAHGADPLEERTDHLQDESNALDAAVAAGQLDVVQLLLRKDLRLNKKMTGSILRNIRCGKTGKDKLIMILETLRHQGLLYEQSTDAGNTLCKSVIEAAIRNSRLNVDIMTVFLDWRPDVSLPNSELLLKYALQHTGNLMELLFERYDAHLSPALVSDIQEMKFRVDNDSLDWLAVELPDELSLTEGLLGHFVKWGKLETIESLLQSRRQYLHVTQRILEAAIGRNKNSVNCLRLLWPYREPGIEVSERMIQLAEYTENDNDGPLEFLSQKLPGSLRLNDKVILEIISKSRNGVATLKMFLSHPSLGISISEILIETICSHTHAPRMLKLLQKNRELDFSITETMVCNAARNPSGGYSVVRYLAELLPGSLSIPEKAFVDLIRNTKDDEDLRLLMQDYADVILTEQVFLAACSNEAAMKVVLNQKKKEPPIEKMLMQFANQPKCSKPALHALLERDFVKIDENLVEIFANNPTFLSVLLSCKPDAPITEEALLLASRNSRSIHLMITAHGKSLAFTEDFLIAAIKAIVDRALGSHSNAALDELEFLDVMDIILIHQGEISITKKVIRSACTGSFTILLLRLLQNQPVCFVRDIWQEIWTEGKFNSLSKTIVLMAFLSKSGSHVTDAMVESFPYDPDKFDGFSLDDFIQLLCGGDSFTWRIKALGENNFFPRLPTTERATEIIVERCRKDAIQKFFDCNQINVTEKILQAGERNKVADKEKLMAFLEQKKCIQ